jgi:hypothetical protein
MMSRARAWIVLLLAISAVPAWAQQQVFDPDLNGRLVLSWIENKSGR